jgi:hypothetical protein
MEDGTDMVRSGCRLTGGNSYRREWKNREIDADRDLNMKVCA